MGQIKNKKHDKTVGCRISEMRQKAGFKSLIDFAERYNFDYQTLRSIESGHLTINTATLKWFAETLKVSSDYLLGLTDIQTPDVKEREVTEKYGLTGESLKSLSDYADRNRAFLVDKNPLKALNAILSNDDLCDTILYTIHDILFSIPDDTYIDIEVTVSKRSQPINNLFLYTDIYRELQIIVLHRFLSELREELEQDAIKAENTKKTTTLKKGDNNGEH